VADQLEDLSTMVSSNSPADKMRAAVNRDSPDADMAYPPEYVAACREWYAVISASDKVLAEVVRATFKKRDEPEAARIAAALPAAPLCPIR
jgi:hypothetical protein